MSDQNMDPKKRNIIIGCSVAGAVVIIAAIIAVIFTTGALNKIGIGSSSANTVSYSDTERFSQGISIEGIDISGMTKEEAMEALLQAEVYPKGYDIQLTLEDQTVALTGKELPFDLHLQDTIDEAYEYNWHCNEEEHASRVAELSVTPKDFELKPSLISEELFALYVKALDRLPVRCREVFIRIREEKQSYAQVAEELGISMNTVDAQLQKAITRLKEMISRTEID